MDLNALKKDARNVAYQLRKNFSLDESPVSHYVCENQVVVISTKKLYIFYVDTSFTDYTQAKLDDVVIKDIDLDNNTCNIVIHNRLFICEFQSKKELEYLLQYYNKYLIK